MSLMAKGTATPTRNEALIKPKMQIHPVKVHPSKEQFPREEQLAWKIASVASDVVPVQPDVTEIIINRIIDNAVWRLPRSIAARSLQLERWLLAIRATTVQQYSV